LAFLAPGRDHAGAKPAVVSRGLEHRRSDARDPADRVEQTVVVNQAVVARARDIDSGMIELIRIGFAFVTQDIHLSRLNDGGRHAPQPLVRRLERGGINILPLPRVGRVAVPGHKSI